MQQYTSRYARWITHGGSLKMDHGIFRKLLAPTTTGGGQVASPGMVRVLVTGSDASQPIEVILKAGESAAAAALLAGLSVTRTHPLSGRLAHPTA
jgi:hypothetical protein